ncbi:histidine triad nucleotide-binding protein [Nocardioidaceae bacterium]|nr:histidine triad nucleotide-binding protein [Nocardioidaceae bacterium]
MGRLGDMSDTDCLFCTIVAGDVPADVVAETDACVAFRDINAQAPTHVLVIPREHHENAAALAAEDPDVLADLVRTAHQVAADEGLTDDLDERGYRLVFNTGAGIGQSVFHVHLHVLGGRPMSWPPG